jgi:hypothetical protein
MAGLRIVALLIAILTLGACATTALTEAQREQQAFALQRNELAIAKVTAGMSKADVLGTAGIAGNRRQYRSNSGELVDIWSYPTTEGYVSIKFLEGSLAEKKLFRSRAVIARDATVPLTRQDMDIHLFLATVRLGWTMEQVEQLPIKTMERVNEFEAARFLDAFRQAAEALKDSGPMAGADFSEMDAGYLRGDLWLYQGPRLGGWVIFRNNAVSMILFTEQGTKAQMKEAEQRLF